MKTKEALVQILTATSTANQRDKIHAVQELERLNPTERHAASPLLDGAWITVYCDHPPLWAMQQPMVHLIQGAWDEGAVGAYTQRVPRHWRIGHRQLSASFTVLGGTSWDLRLDRRGREQFGFKFMRNLASKPDIDLDYSMRPTYVDGDTCILRAPPVVAGQVELRPGRVYLCSRLRHPLYQDESDDPFESFSRVAPGWVPRWLFLESMEDTF